MTIANHAGEVAKENGIEREDLSGDSEKEASQIKDVDTDNEPSKDTQTLEENKFRRASRVPQKITKKQGTEIIRPSRVGARDRRESNKLQFKTMNSNQNRSQKPNKISLVTNDMPENKSAMVKIPDTPSESSEGSVEKTGEEKNSVEEIKEGEVNDEETGGADENVFDVDDRDQQKKIDEMEMRITKLEQELREVAALEISLYSVVPEHGSSSHKLHTPARRLSRMYIHACKHWTQDRKATVAKNAVSGLVLIAKSSGNDVPRLTFWLSNTVVLRDIISQAFGVSKMENKFSPGKLSSNGNTGKQTRNLGIMPFMDDWQDTRTFITALEKIESWMFSRIVESIWWQTLAPYMQSPDEGQDTQHDGNFSVNVWKNAFREAFKRLCPVREGKHECGCLPFLARMVMEQCVARLDVAMFNAILRESANEIPTDPVSDPILDHKVLPIPAGELSFGSGAQLKNSIGNWSRCLADLFGMNYGETEDEDDDPRRGDVGMSKAFPLLSSLSDLLMLPKDMLLSKSIRKEVCPEIGLPLITRILCNFAPDEFCPDPVPGIILEELSAEMVLERRSLDKALINNVPCAADPVSYAPPATADVAGKAANCGGEGAAALGRSPSVIQRRGYTSDDDLEDLDSPLTSVVDRRQVNAGKENGNGRGIGAHKESAKASMRFKLLLEVWSE
ncbi:nucleolar protein gar2-like protein [Wolffia australiana]